MLLCQAAGTSNRQGHLLREGTKCLAAKTRCAETFLEGLCILPKAPAPSITSHSSIAPDDPQRCCAKY